MKPKSRIRTHNFKINIRDFVCRKYIKCIASIFYIFIYSITYLKTSVNANLSHYTPRLLLYYYYGNISNIFIVFFSHIANSKFFNSNKKKCTEYTEHFIDRHTEIYQSYVFQIFLVHLCIIYFTSNIYKIYLN